MHGILCARGPAWLHEMLFVFAMPGSVPILHFSGPPPSVVCQTTALFSHQRAPAMRDTNSKVRSLGNGHGMPESRGWGRCSARAVRGGSAVALRQEFPEQRHLCCRGSAAAHPSPCVFLCSLCLSSAAAAVGQKVLLLPLGPYLELFWCFISTRCLSPRCLSQRHANNSPPGAFPVT